MKLKNQTVSCYWLRFHIGIIPFPSLEYYLGSTSVPIPLGMDIYINDFADANPHDIKNINLMNHYVGMKYIPESIPEFKIFPAVIIVMSIIGFS